MFSGMGMDTEKQLTRISESKPAIPRPKPPTPSAAQATDTPSRAASLPPPPPSARPRSERPVALPSALPPPLSARPALPSAPTLPNAPVLAQSPKLVRKPDAELVRLEEEVQSLRRRLSAQHEATRIEQKNVELLRAEIAQLRTQVNLNTGEGTSATAERNPAAPAERKPATPAEKEPTEPAREQEALARLQRQHDAEVERLMRSHELAQKQWREETEAALAAQKQALWSTDHAQAEKDKARLIELESTLKTLRQSNIVLRQRLEEVKNAQLPGKNPPPADDLTELKGIGPALSKALAKEGITTFAQIAGLSDKDVEALAKKIGVSAARIAKNEWVKTAFKLSISR